MSSLIFSKQKSLVKRKRNHSKRARLNSQGFKVYKNFILYIALATISKPAPRKAIVNVVRNLWNTDHSVNKMRKHIKALSIRYTQNGIAGSWCKEQKRIVVNDNGRDSIKYYIYVLVHEVVGHAFWDFSRKWRRQELIAFNKLANKLSPINTYVQKNADKWKIVNDDYDELRNLKGHETMTRYANEQHSAITEIKYGTGGHEVIINNKDKQKLIKLWEALHY